jgi:hypothetical protein
MSHALETLLAQLPHRYHGGHVRLRALLGAIATGDDFIETQVKAVRDNLLVPTASGSWLDRRASLYGVTRGNGAGIMDVDFRGLIPLLGMSPKQITTTINALLDVVYGPYSTHANLQSKNSQPYEFVNGDQINFLVDSNLVSVAFTTSDFVNIAAATAQEIATAITRKTIGRVIGDIVTDASTGAVYVTARSGTIGPQGFLQVAGGNAQARLLFPSLRRTSQGIGTWVITRGTADQMVYTLTSGVWPGLVVAGVIRGDLVTIRTDSGFTANNCGTYPLAAYGSNWFALNNGEGTPEIAVTQAHVDDICFYENFSANILIAPRPASAIETVSRKLVIMMPVTSPVVKRTLKGSHHLHGGMAGVLSTTLNTATLSNINAFPSSGTIRPVMWRGNTSGIVLSVLADTITLLNSQNWPQYGSIWSSTHNTYYQYSSIIGNVLQGVTPTPPSDISGQVIHFTPLWSYSSIVGSTLQNVYPDPSSLTGLEITSSIQIETNYWGGFLYDTGRNPIGTDDFWHPALLSPPPQFTLSKTATTLSGIILQGSNRTLVQMADVSDFPLTGSIIFEFGSDLQEGPVKYLGISGAGGLILDPSYVFKLGHSSGVSVRLIALVGEYTPRLLGEDYPAYTTSTAPARALMQSYIRDVVAAGVSLEFDVNQPTYKWGLPVSLYSVNPNSTAL